MSTIDVTMTAQEFAELVQHALLARTGMRVRNLTVVKPANLGALLSLTRYRDAATGFERQSVSAGADSINWTEE